MQLTVEQRSVELVRPAFDGGVHEVTANLQAGSSLTVESPVRLVFDPDVPPSGGSDRFRWSIAPQAALTEVNGVARFGDRQLPFAADLDPGD